MNGDDPVPDPQPLSPASFVVIAATLACMAAIPAAFWLADVALLPWADGLRWEQLRAQTRALDSSHTDDFVEIQRGPCFGACPIYSVRLYASGRVDYDGQEFVCALGAQAQQVDPGRAGKLIADIAAADYFELNWAPNDQITDQSTATTQLTYRGRTRTIRHYHGDTGAPRVLEKMERAIDDIAVTSRWLPRREGREWYCRADDGTRIPFRGF